MSYCIIVIARCSLIKRLNPNDCSAKSLYKTSFSHYTQNNSEWISVYHDVPEQKRFGHCGQGFVNPSSAKNHTRCRSLCLTPYFSVMCSDLHHNKIHKQNNGHQTYTHKDVIVRSLIQKEKTTFRWPTHKSHRKTAVRGKSITNSPENHRLCRHQLR